MNIRILTTVLVAFVFGLTAAAQDSDAKKAPARPKLVPVKIKTLNGVKANKEFQDNVRLVKAQRQRLIKLDRMSKEAATPADKKKAKEDFEKLRAQLEKNNQKMVKAYGFSLNRNYIIETEKASLYLLVTPEENAKIEAGRAQRAEAAKKAAPAKAPAKKASSKKAPEKKKKKGFWGR